MSYNLLKIAKIYDTYANKKFLFIQNVIYFQ